MALFKDYQYNLDFELQEDGMSLTIKEFTQNISTLEKIYRLLFVYIRSGSLDGEKVYFNVEKPSGSFLLIKGNLSNALDALEDFPFISKDVKEAINEKYAKIRAQGLGGTSMMKFNDIRCNLSFELQEDGSNLVIKELSLNIARLESIARLLKMLIRISPREGGKPLCFSVENNTSTPSESYLLIQGNLFDALSSLSTLDSISDEVRKAINHKYSEIRAQELRDNAEPGFWHQLMSLIPRGKSTYKSL